MPLPTEPQSFEPYGLPSKKTLGVAALAEGNRTLWIGNVEAWMDEAYLTQTFGTVGTVCNVKIVRDSNRAGPLGFAFVELGSREEMIKLLERLNGQPFIGPDGYRFRVNWATHGIGERTGTDVDISLYVGNLDNAINDMGLYKAFERRFSSVIAAKVIVDATTGASRGFGFVRFRDPDEAEAALTQMQGMHCGTRPLKLRKAIKQKEGFANAAAPGATGPCVMQGTASGASAVPAPPPPPPAVHPTTTSVVIAGLYPGLSEGDLIVQFGVFGAVLRVLVSTEQECTQVDFRDLGAATNAAQYLQQSGVQAEIVGSPADWPVASAAAANAAAAAAVAAADATASLQREPPAITNMTTAQAAGELRAQLHRQLRSLAQPSPQHFAALLREPCFERLFAEALCRRVAAAEKARQRLRRLPWLLKDGQELFEAEIDVRRMNSDFLPAYECSRMAGTVRIIPLVPVDERLLG